MKLLISFVFGSLLFISTSSADWLDGLYVKAYGDNGNQSIIFIHGGPGYDSQAFEFSTAQALADAGYYVIVYDQRGQGRSDVASSPQVYNYKTYADDLIKIINFYGLKQPILMGHSHGGAIALKFEQYYPQIAKNILLVSAPVNMWASMEAIKTNCTASYTQDGKTGELGDLQNVFTTLETPNLPFEQEIPAISQAFRHAMACGVYNASAHAPGYEAMFEQIVKNYVQTAQENVIYPTGNFVIYEDYIHLDNTSLLIDNAARIFAIYGDEDGLFTFDILNGISQNLMTNPSPYRFQLIHQASHNIFMDQQPAFIDAVIKATSQL